MRDRVMHRFFLPHWFGVIMLLLLSGVSVLLVFCWCFGIWSWSDWQTYQEMSRECHPVWRELHSGRICEGQNVDEVIAKTQPLRIDSFEGVTCLSYHPPMSFTNVTIYAQNGRIVKAEAASCTWAADVLR
jgi:hypothetical protein